MNKISRVRELVSSVAHRSHLEVRYLAALAVSRVRSGWRQWVAEIFISIILAIISVRQFIFGQGYYQYADQKWPLTNNLLPYGLVSVGGFNYNVGAYDTFGFTRLFVDWPYFITNSLANAPIESEKLFVIYLFVVFLLAAYALTDRVVTLTLRLLGKSASVPERELLKFVGVLFAFANLTVINLNADLSAGTDSLIILLLGLVLLVVVSERSPIRVGILTGIIAAVVALLDPDYVLVVGIVFLVTLPFKSCWWGDGTKFLKAVGIAIAVSLPALIFATFLIRASFPSYPATLYRSLSLPTLEYQSRFLSLWNASRLFGYEWSIVSFGPPTILNSGRSVSSLPYLYEQILEPAGLVTQLWKLSLVVPILLATATLLSHRLKAVALPGASVALVSLLLTQYASSPFLYAAVLLGASIPVIGPEIGETFALPSHFLIVLASAIVVLVPVAVTWGYVALREYRETPSLPATRSPTANSPGGTRYATARSWSRRRLRRFPSIVFVVVVIAIVAFSGWQAFNGSYFPSRYYGGYGSGNFVPDTGAFSPVSIPQDVLTAYDYISHQSGSFNVVWPTYVSAGVPYYYLGSTLHQPNVNPPALGYLVSNGDYSSIAPYLRAIGVRFLVMPYSGVESSELTALNESPGIERSLNLSSLTLYTVSDCCSYTYAASVLLDPDEGDDSYSQLYGLFDSIGTSLAVAAPGTGGDSVGVNSLNHTVVALSPSFIASNTPYQFSTALNASNSTLNWSQTAGSYEFDGWNSQAWWGVNLSGSYSNRTVTIATTEPNTASLSWGLPIVGYPGGTAVPTPTKTATVANLRFEYRTASDFSGSLYAFSNALVNNSTTYPNIDQLPLNATTEWTPVSFSTTIPSGYSYFGIQIRAANFTGEVQIRDLVQGWSFLDASNATPFGMLLSSNATLPLSGFQGTALVGVAADSSQGGAAYSVQWVSEPVDGAVAFPENQSIAGVVVFNRTSLPAIATNVTVFDEPFLQSFEYQSGPHVTFATPGADAINLFLNTTYPGGSISISSLQFWARLGYGVVLVELGLGVAAYLALKPGRIRPLRGRKNA